MNNKRKREKKNSSLPKLYWELSPRTLPQYWPFAVVIIPVVVVPVFLLVL
jgi:hypothetical protein